jgi:hypothetical protein
MIEPHVPIRFEHRIASYSKWHIAVRGIVTYFVLHRETYGISGYGALGCRTGMPAFTESFGGYRTILGHWESGAEDGTGM